MAESRQDAINQHHEPVLTHAHVTETWKGLRPLVIATSPSASGMGMLLCVFDNSVAQLRDVIGCKPRDPANGPHHMRQILDSETDGWIQVDLFECTDTRCLDTGFSVTPPAYVANRYPAKS